MILASTSHTRAQILKAHNIAFHQIESGFDEESITTQNPKSFVWQACLGKLQAACKKCGKSALESGILAADSVVCTQGLLQRKAKTLEQARNMLEFQSMRSISIFTAMGYKSLKGEFYDISATHYKLKSFDSKDLEIYLESKMWQGKAGCVMVEGFHKKYILSQEGLESCALGLSIEKLLVFLGII